MILAITGHRPNKFGHDGYKVGGPVELYIKSLIKTKFLELKPYTIISGMALGVDQWAAEVAIELGVQFIAAIPCAGQELKWPHSSQTRYKKILHSALGVFILSERYTDDCMQKRNEWMVNRCNQLLAIWDGSPGGTGNCVAYASSKQVPIIKVDPIAGKAFNSGQTVEMVNKLTDLIQLPRIKVDFTIRNSAKHTGMYHWHFYYETHRLSFKKIDTSLLTIMHEVAHYWDYFNRMREIRQRFGFPYAQMNKASPENQKLMVVIKKKHAHGKAHKQFMDMLCEIVQKTFPEYVTQGPESEEISACKSQFNECKPTSSVELMRFIPQLTSFITGAVLPMEA